MADDSSVVHDEWNTYVTSSDDKPLFISFDEEIARDERPPYDFCARILISIQAPNEGGAPLDAEAELLWDMEDDLCEFLQAEQVPCRLIGRLTFDGVRELVFQLRDWESFRPPVGAWLSKQEEYEIDVSEHEGWGFFNDCIQPTLEDRIFMMDHTVVSGLLDAGSDPDKEHDLEYVFDGNAAALQTLTEQLLARGYLAIETPDYSSGQVVLVLRTVLDLDFICDESIANHHLAESCEAEFNGWGAAVVK